MQILGYQKIDTYSNQLVINEPQNITLYPKKQTQLKGKAINNVALKPSLTNTASLRETRVQT